MSTPSRDNLTRDEAVRRHEQVSGVAYRLDLDLEEGAKGFRGDVTIEFHHSGGDTFLEWLGGQIDQFEVNGTRVEPMWDGYRIKLPGEILERDNRIRVVYQRPYDKTGEGLHHFTDNEDGREYLYTQFEPYSAHRLFPCFDQPDLKAAYDLAVTAPEGWVVTGPSRELDREPTGDGRSRRVFARTVPFSTYLMSIVAGPYAEFRSSHGDLPLGLYARASLRPHLEKDAASLFELCGRIIDHFTDLFGEPYPFDKSDHVFVPEFNWGGMENVGNITYTDSVVFREPPTADQLQRRAEFFAHEIAHMWFGDLVTMKWWEDVWLNESFASYVAYLALDALGDTEIWQDFNFRMKLWAYREDQRPTTHRIADSVGSTDETFLNFDGITYGKGASVLKQLVRAIGLDAFRDGLRTYFRRHRFGNATLVDFLAALQEGSGIDLVGWGARWLKTPSLNTISARVTSVGDTVTRLELRQSASEEHPYLRPHHLDVALIAPGGAVRSVAAVLEDVVAVVPEAEGSAVPAFVYPNLGDHGYAKISLDEGSVAYAAEHLGSLGGGLLRQQVWASLYEMVRDGTLSSLRYLELVDRHLPGESSLPVVDMVTAIVAAVISRFVPEEGIDGAAAAFVATATRAITAAPPGDARVMWARALIATAVTEEDARAAAELVDRPPAGLAVDQDMRWSVAVRWASIGIEGTDVRLAAERRLDPSDRGDRAMVTAAAARPDGASKQEVWDRTHGNGYESLYLMRAAGNGFWWRKQAALVEPFVAPFFAGLADLFSRWEVEAARAYFRVFFPRHRIDENLRERIAGVLAAVEIGPVLRRMLIEEDDELRRAIACRAVAAATPATPTA
ncbi:MAG TPA: aminopeptidase N [Acidimicrobiia bacterium]|nr:aminopeptidase N [Acidimicrobiia bacterium]